MDLGRPGAAVLAKGTEAVLRALAGTTAPMGVRQVARVAGVSANRAGQVLGQLIDHGLVLAEDQGTSRLCRLNRAHLAAEPVIALVGLRQRLIDLLRREIESWEFAPEHASLFGSAARGDGDTRSDLDLLVVRRGDVDDDAWDTQLDHSGRKLFDATGNHVAWFDITLDDLARSLEVGEPVVAQWQQDGVHLAGQRLATLIRRTA